MSESTVHPNEDTVHISNSVYLIVGAFLVILTAMEVSVTYIRALHTIMVPLLLVLAAAKFILIAAFFMHLRYEKWVLNTTFLFPLTLAAAVLLALLGLFTYLDHHLALGMPLQAYGTWIRP